MQHKNWNLGDKLTAKYVKDSLKRDSRTLVVMGNLYVRKYAFTLERKKFIPAGSYLRNNGIAVHIRYPIGLIFNFKEIIVNDNEAKKLLKETDKSLIKSHSRYFDYDYIVSKKVRPLTLDSNL